MTLVVLMFGCVENTFTKPSENIAPIDSGKPDCPPGIPDCYDSDPPESDPPDSPVDTAPEDCSVTVEGPDVIDVVEECTGTEPPTVTDPWDVAVEWQWTGGDSYHLPLIGNLTDDNGDGDIDEDDVPDVVVITTSNVLYVLDGATGSEHWSASGYKGYAVGTLADVDGDGISDIVAFSSAGKVVALDYNGSVIWTSSQGSSVTHPLMTVSDLDEDGLPEILTESYVLNGEDGTLDFTVPTSGSIPYHGSIAADLDLDGDKEVIFQNKVYDHNGTELWSSSVQGSYGHWPVVLQYDSDNEAEVAMVGAGKLAIYEHDGTEILSVSAGTSQPGPPCMGDFDGDGDAEMAWPSSNTFNMYELDGSVVWTHSIDDSSGLAGCSGYDFDGDGALEVLYADQGTFYIWDGATGTLHFSDNNHASGTIFEYPTVADVDNDGSAEVLISHNYGTGYTGVTAFGHGGDGWPKSGTTWHVHDFAVTNINPDGTVPKSPDPSWLKYNVFRARPAVDDPATGDLAVAITDACFVCDRDIARLAIQARNAGGADIDAGTSYAVYAVDNEETLITSGTLSTIPSGVAATGWEIEIPVSSWGRGGIRVVVDDDGTGASSVSECDETNNDHWYTDVPCNE